MKMKTIIRVTLVFFFFALLFVLKIFYEENAISEQSDSEKNNEWLNPSLRTSPPTKPGVVILLTMMRSGSSIVGSIFNERTNVTYLYEPLFPFGEQRCDDETREDSQAVLRHISTCHFEKLPPLYEPSKRNDVHAK